MDHPEPIRVLVADSNRMGSQLLADALCKDVRLKVVHVCTDGSEVLLAVREHRPHVLVISNTLGGQAFQGLEVSRQTRSASPEVRTVMLLDSSEPDLVVRAFAAGCHGVFCREGSIDALRKCICSVHAGQVWASSAEMRSVLEAFADSSPRRLVDARGDVLLSRREQDVVRCVTEGLTNREIAARLKLSEHTVKNYMFRIFDKLGVSTRVEMVLYAFSPRNSAALGEGHELRPALSNLERHRQAAEQGNVPALYKLGEMFSDGQEVPADKLAAYTYFRLGLALANALSEKSAYQLQWLRAKLGREELAEAEARVIDWIARNGDGEYLALFSSDLRKSVNTGPQSKTPQLPQPMLERVVSGKVTRPGGRAVTAERG